MRDATPRPIHLKDYAPPPWTVERVQLEIELDPVATQVTALLDVQRMTDDATVPLRLDGEGLETLSVTLADGTPLPAGYAETPTALTIPGLAPQARLRFVTRIAPARNEALEGLYLSGDVFVTQCEAEGFRRITWFIDRPDVLATYDVALIADPARCPVMLSNGNPAGQETLADGRSRVRWTDPFPKPSYLFALVAGDLAAVRRSFVTRSGRPVRLAVWAVPQQLDQLGHALDSLERAMRWDETRFGREYDLDEFNIVAVDDFNSGAMENTGLNIFNTRYVLAKPETATDADYGAVESVVAHEYFHHWSGNRVTCRDWFQLSLKEGFTVFRDQEFTSDQGGRAVKRIADVEALRRAQFPEDSGPTAHPVRPDSYIQIRNFYTPTVYEKGAEVVRMLYNLLGEAEFRRGCDLYFDRHVHQAVTCEAFVAAMESVSGRDLTQFRRWYAQAGTPHVTASGTWDAEAGRYTLTLTQVTAPTPGQPDKLPLHLPVAMGLVGPDGADLPLDLEGDNVQPAPTTRVLNLTEGQQSWTFSNLPARPLPSLFRGFSAPVRVLGDVSDDELAFLMVHDSDAFNRWEAGQELCHRSLAGLVADHGAGRPLRVADAFVNAVGRVLAGALTDPALAARMLALPDEGQVSQRLARVDVEAVAAAVTAVRSALSRRLRPDLLRLHAATEAPGPYVWNGAEMARRGLRNACLAHILAEPDEEAVALAARCYHAADNMTDRYAALRALADTDTAERAEALAAFLARHGDERLVVDKWFAVQAASRRTDPAAARALMAHPLFTLKNPNRLRSVVGVFPAANFAGFHAADGSGYRLLAETLAELDSFNSQAAARLLTPLRTWRRYDGTRQALMRTELERLLNRPGVSADMFELVSKSLDPPPAESLA